MWGAMGVPVELRVPWWQWVVISAGGTLLTVVLTAVGMIALALQGVNLLDYFVLQRPPVIDSSAVSAWIGLILGGQLAGPVLVAFLLPGPRRLLADLLGRPDDPAAAVRRVLLGGLLFTGLQFVWGRVAPQASTSWQPVQHLAYAVGRGAAPGPVLLMLAAVGLAAPLFEELLFRGLLFGYLRHRWSFWAGAGLSAAAFGLMHGPLLAIPTGLMGLYFAWQVERDGHLYGAAALHCLHNLVATALMIWLWLPV